MNGTLVFGRPLSCIKSRILNKEYFNKCVTSSSFRGFSLSSSKNMKLVQFSYNEKPKNVYVGYVEGNGVVDVNKLDNTLSNTLLGILNNGDLEKVKGIKLKNPTPEPLSNIRLVAPITGQDKVLCIGLNYMDHCKEQNKTPPEVPMIFSKFASCVIGPNDPVKLRTEVTKKTGKISIKITRLNSKKSAAEDLRCVKLEAPISGQDKILCIGLNYHDHCTMHKLKPPKVPMFFSKYTSTIIGPNDVLKLRTDVTEKVDWEVELALVIGKEASCVKAADAFNYILGYTVAQDISARDWQKDKNAGQFLLGKSMDTFCPIGPWIVTSDEIGDPQKLDIECSVNGELKQNSNTCQLVHKIPDVIERLTSVMTLYPGDILLTGTPGGVGLYLNPPQFLKPGDVVTSTIQNIGTLETKIEQYVKKG